MKLKLFLLVVLFFTNPFVNAQTQKKVNTTDFIFECSKVVGDLPSKQMTIWFPNDLWNIIGDQMKLSKEVIASINNEMKDYMLFAVVDYKMESGKVTFASEEEIRKTIVLIDASKKSYKPLENEDLPTGTRRIVESLTPIMGRLLGQFGEGMKIIMFDAPKAEGKNTIDLSKQNNFSLSWNSTVLKWKMPFYSVLPSKYCPVDKEEMKGNWSFCPEHGKKLAN